MFGLTFAIVNSLLELVGLSGRWMLVPLTARAAFTSLRLFLLPLGGQTTTIDRTFGFEQIVDAYRFLESAAHFGKIAIDLDA